MVSTNTPNRPKHSDTPPGLFDTKLDSNYSDEGLEKIENKPESFIKMRLWY